MNALKLFVSVCLFVIISFVVHAVPVSGIKTIGGLQPDYATLTAAVSSINNNGVGSGGVTFIMRAGTYAGGVTISVSGTDTGPIVFQSEDMHADSVIISANSIYDVITLQGADYVTFSHLTLYFNGLPATSGTHVVQLENGAHFTTFNGCMLKNDIVNQSGASYSIIFGDEAAAADACGNLVVKNSIIRGGSYGIYLSMDGQPKAPIIENTRFEHQDAGALYLYNLAAPMLTGNTVVCTQTDINYRGFHLSDCDGKTVITHNYFYTEGAGIIQYGIDIGYCDGPAGNNALVANNSIQVAGNLCTAYTHGFSPNYDIMFNTFYVASGTTSSTYAFNTDGLTGLTIKNNIFANFATATGVTANNTVRINNATGGGLLANNFYWTEGAGNPFRATYGGSYSSLSAFAGATGETNASNYNPQMIFIPGKGWKATNPVLIGAGVQIAGITDDIDGKTRAMVPTVGAHENGCVPINIALLANGNTNLCPGDSVELSTTPGAGNTYVWMRDTATVGAAQGPSLTVADAGSYTLYVTDSNGCAGTSNAVAVTKYAAPVVTIQSNITPEICVGEVAILTTALMDVVYQWFRDAQPLANTDSAAYYASAAGSYTLLITDTNGCATVSNAVDVAVNALPVVSLAAFDTACSADGVITLAGGSPAGGAYLVDGIVATTFNPSTGAGTYTVEYHYTDSNNCAAGAAQSLAVEICDGTRGIVNNYVAIFPNPATDILSVNIAQRPGTGDATVCLYDSGGKEIHRQSFVNGGTNMINVTHLKPGVYLLIVSVGGKQIGESKFSIRR